MVQSLVVSLVGQLTVRFTHVRFDVINNQGAPFVCACYYDVATVLVEKSVIPIVPAAIVAAVVVVVSVVVRMGFSACECFWRVVSASCVSVIDPFVRECFPYECFSLSPV